MKQVLMGKMPGQERNTLSPERAEGILETASSVSCHLTG